MKNYNDLESYVIKHRRYLHEFPELGFECVKTHDYIRNELKRFQINFFPHIGKNSIVGVLENGKGPVIGLRADFDALSLEEDNELEFKSKNIGKMHACGHDCHAGMLLGAVKYLSEHLDEWKGTVKFIFQEAEEGPNPGGALGIVASGILDDVDEFFALHVSTGNIAGQLSYNDRETLASADTIKIKFIGKGGHAAYPHASIDPIVMQAEFIVAVQSIVSRKLNPMDTGVITIAQVKAGTTQVQASTKSISLLSRPSVDKPVSKVNCPYCHTEISQDAKFCPHCGSGVEEKLKEIQEKDLSGRHCVNCGVELLEEAKFCAKCGQKV